MIGLVGSVFALTLLEIIYLLICKKGKSTPLFTGLSKAGEKSLQIYILSVPLLEGYMPILLPKLFSFLGVGNVLVKNMLIYNFGFTLLLALMYLLALYFLIKFLEKTKIAALMFGK